MEHKAIPTNYKGVTYRSKSEAIFAKALDLFFSSRSDLQGSYCYEPIDWWIAPMDYTPDFDLVVKMEKDNHRSTTLIEYKPSEPSSSYLHRLEKIAYKAHELAVERMIPDFAVWLAYGNAYDDYLTILEYDIHVRAFFQYRDDFSDKLLHCMRQAKSYRFDIKGH